MKRYRGVDKAPGPSLSPPRHGGLATRSGSMELQRSVARLSKQTPDPMINRPSASLGSDPLMITGSGANSFYLDPRTKQPVKMPTIPQAGRSIPKLRMEDLASSLSPLTDSGVMLPRVPFSKAEKRIAATLKEVTAPPTKDMLESFDEALRAPDMKAINSRVAQLKKGLDVPSIPKLLPTKSSNLVGVKSKTSTTIRKQGPTTSKAEEQNIKMLMNQLKDKYLDDMESQLGLAVERRPRQARASETWTSDDQSGGDGPPEYRIPRPSTNATEIAARIDKVVRDWTTESQKMARSTNVSKQASFHQASRGANQDTATSPLLSPNTLKGQAKPKAATDVVPGKNENLEKISSAFRKTLDPISNRDVTELINIPEDDNIDKLQEEHEERRRAHESVFKNAVVMHGTPKNKKTASKKNTLEAPRKQETPTGAETKQKVNNHTPGLSVVETQKDTRKPFAQAIEAAKDDKDEMYTIIKDHMAYEMASRPPKLSAPRKPSYTKVRQQPSLLRTDVAGKALLKYSESHKKLQNLVDSFKEKVDPSTPAKKVVPPVSDDSLSDTSQITEDISDGLLPGAQLAALASKTVLPSRKHVSLDVSATLSKSVKSIRRASGVVQRLGTLMNRVNLRHEKYDYEKQLEEDAKAASIGTDPMDFDNGNFPLPDAAALVEPHYPSGEEMDSLLKRAAAIEIPKDLERPGMGPAVSLNAILRARMMDGKGKEDGK